MRQCMIGIVTLLAASTLYAEPPKLTLKEESKSGSRWVVVRAETQGKEVKFVPGPGLDPFPLSLPEKKVFVAIAEGKGPWKVQAYTSLNDELSDLVEITVGGSTSPPVTPPTNPPTQPPVTTGLYFLIVRPDGPASPAFTNNMKLTEWQTLIKLGHSVKDKTASEAATFGVRPTTLPAVARLIISPDGKSSKLFDIVPLPTTGADILRLPEGVK